MPRTCLNVHVAAEIIRWKKHAKLGTLKIHKKSNFDRNTLKLATQHKNMYMYQEKLLK